MRLALIADVHANLAALEAVLAMIECERLDGIVCLGDLVGYNADPVACVDLVRSHARIVVAGNHDRSVAVGLDAPGTHETAQRVNAWTRAQLDRSRREYLCALPSAHVEPDRFVAVHGCYLNDTHTIGYVTSTMLRRNLDAVVARGDWPRVAFCGHTHAPMCGWLVGQSVMESELRSEVQWPHSSRAVLLNPGSVGQPRDGDPRASFALVDLEQRTAEVRRVQYDVERSVAAIVRAGLPESLAQRLREGR